MRTLSIVLLLCSIASADLYRWDTGELIPGTEGILVGPGSVLVGMDLNYADLQGADASNGVFEGSRMYRIDLSDANLTNVRLSGADLGRAMFNRANLTGANLSLLASLSLDGADFTDAIISKANMRDATGRGFTKEQLYSTRSYKQKNLQGIELGAILRGWDFSGQNLTDANLSDSYLETAVFSDAVIIGAQFSRTFTVDQLQSTASWKNKSLRGVRFHGLIDGADLSGQDLRNAKFQKGNCDTLSPQGLLNSNLNGANLLGVDFQDVCVTGSTFIGAIGYVPAGQQRTPGDANLDGLFNSSDLVQVFGGGLYETSQAASWEQGDWNVDGLFNTRDLTTAFQAGAYSPGSRAVPEPAFGCWWLLVGLLAHLSKAKK